MRDDVLRWLRERGLRATGQRIAILETLGSAGRPLTAREIHALVQAAHPTISLDTVYRTLATLAAAGVVGQINLQNREAARFELQGDVHHHHAVCLGCGTSYCLPECAPPLDRVLPGAVPGFRVVGHAFEVYGYCPRCDREQLSRRARPDGDGREA
ncbi:transcriptional repressor [Thermaerobacter sp. PB12/4term]|uniref:Fur family transcriptional regulator n=1 Tax=Thermaerobacter sp. PB12/4term TaxID=2293838 RepID=UPI000E329D95|nr:transcriptional repressor [Thermaerobacter sp. PB12/4term]QIA27707.1 transcriptional repressor [Thermaerobacter sp. PB12/4term]